MPKEIILLTGDAEALHLENILKRHNHELRSFMLVMAKNWRLSVRAETMPVRVCSLSAVLP